MKKAWLAIALVALLTGFLAFLWQSSSTERPPEDQSEKRIIINEALRTLLYLPLYHAKHRGFFEEEGLNVEIVTGGTATNSFASMLSGEADFSQADPMYVPISRAEGAQTKVVAQVVGRIAVWGVSLDPTIQTMSPEVMRGRTISTHPRPMTAYTYTVKTIRDAGLEPGRDVMIIESTPGTEIVPLLSGRADFALTLEPNTSQAVLQGAHVVLSYPELLGDQIFTGLMAREDYINSNRETVVSVVRAYQRALQDLRLNPRTGVETGAYYFPELDEKVLKLGVQRMIDENVIPESVLIPEESWNRAVAVRVQAGDLANAAPRGDACSLDIMEDAAAVPESP